MELVKRLESRSRTFKREKALFWTSSHGLLCFSLDVNLAGESATVVGHSGEELATPRHELTLKRTWIVVLKINI